MVKRITTLQVYGVPGRAHGSQAVEAFLVEFSPPFVLQKNDTGIQFVMTMVDQDGQPLDLQDAIDLTVKFMYPDRTTKDVGGILFTDGSDGKLYYTTVDGDLSQFGTYQIQPKVTFGGFVKSGAVDQFEVMQNVDDN